MFRTRSGKEKPEPIAVVSADQTAAYDREVAAGERVAYSVIALDRDGLESDPAQPIEVTSEGYGLSATARPDGVHLEWNPRAEEGYRGGHITRSGMLQQKDLGFSPASSFVDTDVRPGATYRYTVVLEGPNQTLAPRSSPVEISIPERRTD